MSDASQKKTCIMMCKRDNLPNNRKTLKQNKYFLKNFIVNT